QLNKFRLFPRRDPPYLDTVVGKGARLSPIAGLPPLECQPSILDYCHLHIAAAPYLIGIRASPFHHPIRTWPQAADKRVDLRLEAVEVGFCRSDRGGEREGGDDGRC